MSKVNVITPDLGDFEQVPIIELFVSKGDTIAINDPILAIESDKATMEIPAEVAGVVETVYVKVGDKISSGMALLALAKEANPKSPDQNTTTTETKSAAKTEEKTKIEEPKNALTQKSNHHQLVVIGSGPGGYTAAFRAADLGLEVTLIERFPSLGGVCLNVGCIPSKALLHVAKTCSDAEKASHIGVDFHSPKINIEKVKEWKKAVVSQLTTGLSGLAKKRNINIIQGDASFLSSNTLKVDATNSEHILSFDQAIIATGSKSVTIPSFPHNDSRVMDSTDALALDDIPSSLLIIGGGIIGLEMATVYHALGSKVSIVELLDTLITEADTDLVRPLQNQLKKQYENIWLKTKVTAMQAEKSGIRVHFDGENAPASQIFSKVLVAVGRKPNGKSMAEENAGIEVNDQGFIPVNNQQQTNIPHIFAIGDIVGQPMLAHKAVHEGKVAAEVAAGLKSGFEARVIPSVAYTDPEIAWVGMTEKQAKKQGIDYGKGSFPWAASGRALSQARPEGTTKLLFDIQTDKIIGAGITGAHAGDLLAEAVLAIEMNADANDLSLTIHPHPTLSETLGFAAEMFEGTITDLYAPKKW